MSHLTPTLEERLALIETYVLPRPADTSPFVSYGQTDPVCDCGDDSAEAEPAVVNLTPEAADGAVEAVDALVTIAHTAAPENALVATQALIDFYLILNEPA